MKKSSPMKHAAVTVYALAGPIGFSLQAEVKNEAKAPPVSMMVVPQATAGSLVGYLSAKDLPDSQALLSIPPTPGSAAFAADEAAHHSARRLRDTPRGEIAVKDAVLRFPEAANQFSCALGLRISPETMPNLTMLLRRTMVDAGMATIKAKRHFNRVRPFVLLKESTSTPLDEVALRKDGGYPSGHAAIGWAWALVLLEVAPDQINALLARGFAYGQSRVICGAHWQSDVEAGRTMGAAVVGRLHADPAFQVQVAAARGEIAAARAAAIRPGLDCDTEAKALGGR